MSEQVRVNVEHLLKNLSPEEVITGIEVRYGDNPDGTAHADIFRVEHLVTVGGSGYTDWQGNELSVDEARQRLIP